MKVLSLLLGMILSTSQVWGATYYIDPTCSSSGDGTTTTCGSQGPFKTWAEVSWAAGNTYSQKGGTTAYEQITVGASGAPGNVITINSYGTGKANLNGGITIPPGSWTGPDGNGVYSMPGFGYGMLEDDVFLKWCPVAACASGTGNYRYTWGTGDPEYYKPTTGTPANHVTKKTRPYGIQLGANSYITITGFNLKYYTYGVTGTGLTTGQTNNYITVTGNEFSDMQFGVWINFNSATSQGNKITHNTFDYIMSSIEFQNQADCKSNGIHNSLDISYNTITHCSQIRGSNGVYKWGDVNTAGWDEEGIGFQDLSNSNIHHNTITGVCRGIVLFVCAGDDAYNNNFYNNWINTAKECIMFYPRSDSNPAKSFYNNNAYANILIGGRGGWATTFYAGNVPTPTASYNRIYNNTMINPANGIFGTTTTDYYEIKNNIMYDVSNYFIYLPSMTAPTHMIYDYNLYKGQYTWNSFWVNSAGGKSFAEWKALGANYDVHSPAPADPRFINAAGGVYALTSSSPAKWSGANVGLKTDYADKPAHNPPSIGAYEFFLLYPTPPRNPRIE